MTRFALPPLVLSVALVAGCGEGSPLSPLPTTKDAPPPADTSGATSGGSGGTPAPPPRKREVVTRNPFGGPPANLFADGDFEMSSLPEGHSAQVGWRAFASSGASELGLPAETGGICRTGLRCAVLTEDMLLFIRGTAAPAGAGHVASVWTRPLPGMSCDDVAQFVLVACDSFDALGTLKSVTDEPEASGWCEHRAALEAQDVAVCLYVDSKLSTDERALVDSATLLPDDGSASTPAQAWAPPRDTSDRMNAVRDRIRGTRRFGRPLGWDDDGFPLRPGVLPRRTSTPRAR